MLYQGELSSESLTEVFRNVGQTRKQGILFIETAPVGLEIIFDEGRVIGARPQGGNFGPLVGARAQALGLVRRSIEFEEDEGWRETIQSRELMKEEEIDPLLRLVQEDILYQLPLLSGTQFHFELLETEHFPDMMLDHTPTQLLLEFVELEFSPLRQFDDSAEEECVLQRTDLALPDGLDQESIHLIKLMGRREFASALQPKLPLNRFKFESLLLALEEQGIIDFDVASLEEEEIEAVEDPSGEVYAELERSYSLLHGLRYRAEKDSSQTVITMVLLSIFVVVLALSAPRAVDRFFSELELFTALG